MNSEEQLDPYFVNEATEMLQTIEQTLLNLLEEKTTEKVHTLMRSAHTLKGSSASVGLETIETIAHHLEDVFQALYPAELEIDPELSSLLLDGYECLRTPLTAILSGSPYDETAIISLTASVFAKLQTKLGDFFGREAPPPTSEELGFDVVGSIFADSVPRDLQQLEAAIASSSPEVQILLRSQAEFFLDLATSYNLPGLEEIARATLKAMEQHPDLLLQIAQVALENFQQAQAAMVGGDRTSGGACSEQLLKWGTVPTEKQEAAALIVTTSSEQENTEDSSSKEKDVERAVLEETSSPELTVNSNSPIDRILQSIWIDPQTTLDSSESEKDEALSTQEFPTQDAAALPSIRVAIEQIDRLSHTIGELLIEENQQNLQYDQLHRSAVDTFGQFLRCQQQLSRVRDWSDKQQVKQGQRRKIFQAPTSSSKSEFDTLELDVYSDLHLLLQTLTENMMQLGERIEALDGQIQQSRFLLGKRKQLLRGAGEELLQARMVPLGTVLNRFPRLLQQIVSAHNKPAELKLSGTEVLVDKAISEKIYDPLLHLVRNAYAHGLETPEVRRWQGKSETGQIFIHAYHKGNRTTIEVGDDGQGLNWEKIRQVARDKQLLTQGDEPSQAELTELLFAPGFSTASDICELSGRGVGLDVVRNQLQALKGSISVRSVAGQGTTFILQLPLSLTTARLLVCQSQSLIYALLYEAIDQVLLPQGERLQSQQSIAEDGIEKFLRWGEGESQELIPIRPLADFLSYSYPLLSQDKSSTLSPFPLQPRNTIAPILMLQFAGNRLCLEVDRILVEQELVIKSLGVAFPFPSYIQGYSVLGDGSLTLVMDPVELVAQTRSMSGSPSPVFASTQLLPPQTQESLFSDKYLSGNLDNSEVSLKNKHLSGESGTGESVKGLLQTESLKRLLQTILVVEDSVVQRRSVVRTLENAGYEVLQAENGLEAIASLEKHSEVQLVICDIEMPRMNGFEFLEHCRVDPRFSHIPIVMLTSRSGQKHLEIALARGAKAYLTKPYSDFGLLEIVAELIN